MFLKRSLIHARNCHGVTDFFTMFLFFLQESLILVIPAKAGMGPMQCTVKRSHIINFYFFKLNDVIDVRCARVGDPFLPAQE